MPGWLLICIPVVAATVALGPPIKPRPRLLHPAPKPTRPVVSHPRVPDALARRPRVVRPRPKPVPVAAPACHWVRVPAWLADGLPGGFAPGWWPGYAPAGGYGGWGAYGPAFPVSHGGAWGGPGGWASGVFPGGGWIGGPGYVPVAYPVPVVTPAYAFASAEANALALAVVVVVVNAPPVPAPGPVTPGVDLPGSPPPGALPGTPNDVPEPPALAVVLAGLLGVVWARRART